MVKLNMQDRLQQKLNGEAEVTGVDTSGDRSCGHMVVETLKEGFKGGLKQLKLVKMWLYSSKKR